jgi:hypothetical protein
MLLNTVSVLVAFLLAQTPFLWPHSPAQTVLTICVSVAAATCSLMSIGDRRYRAGVAAAGGLLVLSSFAFPDVFTVAVQLTGGFFLYLAGIAPQVRRVVPAAAAPMFEAAPPIRQAA